ncbi:MAG: ATP-binding cassette domain-containing protein [Candidatus Adiutrix sp.]|jgi:iron(III) transport system ATP-binding protein|nr:ATP-binding cassette domain-containing protein [Candidatus Adiutrix sp.]
MNFLEVKGISKKFGGQTALDQVSLGLEKGELVCLLGPSGCGKTTLLRIIAGLETADRGEVWLEGREATFLPPARRNFGIVFQSYALFPNMTVRQNVLFGLAQNKTLGRAEREQKAEEALEMVDLRPHRHKYPNQLSGGQQQRTALARAIAISPTALLLDEPLSALDAKVRARLRAEICRLQRAFGITTIMVTHDQEEAITMADKIVVMNNAVVEQTGSPRTIYEKPATPFVAGFIGAMNFYPQDGDGGLCAARPEKLEISHQPQGAGSLPAVIDWVEFRGATTRIYARLSPGGSAICVDLSTERADQLTFRANDQVYISVDAGHVTIYSAAA